MPRPQHSSTASWCSGNKLSIARNRALNQVLVLSNELNTSAVRRRHVPQRLPLLGRGADPDPVNQRRVMAGLSEQFDLSSTNGGTVSPISEPGPFVLLITGLSALPWCGIGVRDRAGVPAEALGARLRRWGVRLSRALVPPSCAGAMTAGGEAGLRAKGRGAHARASFTSAQSLRVPAPPGRRRPPRSRSRSHTRPAPWEHR
jgi:hypothetical protein